MPKQIPENELNAIITIIAANPDGVPIRVIRERLDTSMSARMLQHRLRMLVTQGRIFTRGSGKGTRYFPISATEKDETSGAGITISATAEMIRRAVRKPTHERMPVGYHREFLDAYEPNITFYFPVEIRQQLARMGQSPDTTLPAGTYVRKVFGQPARRSAGMRSSSDDICGYRWHSLLSAGFTTIH